MKTITLDAFLTPAQIKRAFKLKTAGPICREIIAPDMAAINRRLGQDNDAMYLAYCCEYVISKVNRNPNNQEYVIP